MTRWRHLVSAALLVAGGLVVAQSAQARPWTVRTLQTGGSAYIWAVDVLPDGRTALLLNRRKGAQSRLELRIGGSIRTLEVARLSSGSALMDHDGRGRLTVAWLSAGNHVVTWTSGGNRQVLGTVMDVGRPCSLDVAPDGHAVLVLCALENRGVFVARRPPGRGFSAPQRVASGTPAEPAKSPAAGVASGGRTVVAWRLERAIGVRASEGAGPFGPTHAVALHARDPGSLVLLTPKLAMTSEGRAVIAISTHEGVSDPAYHYVEAFDWSPGRPGPSPARMLSRGGRTSAGGADVLSLGRAAIIAWTERAAPRRARRVLRTVSWTARGPGRQHTYETHKLALPVVLAPGQSGAADVFYRVRGGHWYTVRITGAGLFRHTTQVTPPDETVIAIDVAGNGRRRVAAWIVRRGRRAGWRVQIARPR